jgi:hypothetical protein
MGLEVSLNAKQGLFRRGKIKALEMCGFVMGHDS